MGFQAHNWFHTILAIYNHVDKDSNYYLQCGFCSPAYQAVLIIIKLLQFNVLGGPGMAMSSLIYPDEGQFRRICCLVTISVLTSTPSRYYYDCLAFRTVKTGYQTWCVSVISTLWITAAKTCYQLPQISLYNSIIHSVIYRWWTHDLCYVLENSQRIHNFW